MPVSVSRRRTIAALSTVCCVFPAVLVAQPTPSPDSVVKVLTSATTRQGAFNVRWSPDGTLLDIQNDNGLLLTDVNPATGARTPFFADSGKGIIAQYNQINHTDLTHFPFTSFAWKRHGHALMFNVRSDTQYFYDRDTQVLRRLIRPRLETPPDADALMRNMAGSQLVNGTYSPDFTHLGYVKGYDLYAADLTTGEETQLTSGGNDSVMHGRPDWVYPEELNQTEAFFWSPDGKKIAYLQFDERPVTPLPIQHDEGNSTEWQRYPKAGAKNPIVKLFVVDLATHKTVEIATHSSPNVYIIRPNWTPDGSELLFQRLNRHQDTLELLAANPATGATRRVLVEHDKAYVNIDGGSPGFGATPAPILFLADGKRFLWPSERDGWRQWYLYDLHGKQLAKVTSGNRVFKDILALDESKGIMYVSAFTNDAQEEHLFRARLDGGGVTQMTSDAGVHQISMDPLGKFYLDVYSSPTHPYTATLYSTEGQGTSIRQIGSVSYDYHGLPVEAPERVTVKAADGVTNLHGILYKPVGYDPQKKYPLLVHVYGGPQAQTVTGTSIGVDQYMMEAQQGYMVWAVDNRGTPNRGRDFERATFLKFGIVDLDDQAAAVKQLIKTHPYIDSTRVGITGASYGGYMSAMALLRHPEVFQVGSAMSAVTDWREYDTIYTERYMRLPSENKAGYDKGSTFTYVKNLRGDLIITHGIADNNVHVENATMLRDSLTKAGKQFAFILYPEYRHGVPSDSADAFLAGHLHPGEAQ